MSEPREPLRRVVVVGDGPLGAMAALALRRALPATQVVVIGVPPHPASFAERSPGALPFSLWLLERLGISEEELVQKCGGSHRLAMRYVAGDWQKVAAYGAEVDPRKHSGFARDWGNGPRNASQPAPPGSLAEILAASGRFAPPSPNGESPLASVEYAMRWNAGALRGLLAEKAQAAGVQRVAGPISALRPDGKGGVAALAIAGAGEIEADLVVDCSGPEAAALSGLPDAGRIDWSRELPVVGAVFGPSGHPMAALDDQLTLTESGWRWDVPGRDGLASILTVAEGASREAAEGAPGGGTAMVPLSPGRFAASWIGNVVALGDAAVQLDPLAGFATDLAHRQLGLLLELLPGREIHALERGEFNRRAALMADRARDVLVAHCYSPQAREVFRDIVVPDELRLIIDQFERRGRIPFFEESPLLTQEWASLLTALSYTAGEGALTQASDPGLVQSAAQAFAARADAALRAAPLYREWLASALAGPA